MAVHSTMERKPLTVKEAIEKLLDILAYERHIDLIEKEEVLRALDRE